MAKNAPKTTANTENNVYNQHKTTTCRITDKSDCGVDRLKADLFRFQYQRHILTQFLITG